MNAGTAPRARAPRPRTLLRIGLVPVAIVAVASAAMAAVVFELTTPSSAELDLKAPPVAWSAGPDSSGNGFVASWDLSDNATYWSITLLAVPEATVTWQNLTSLTNADSTSYDVSVSATDLSAYSKILVAKLRFYEYGTDTLVGTLDLKTGAPLSLGEVAAGASYYVSAQMQLDTGTGDQDLPSSVSISLAVTP